MSKYLLIVILNGLFSITLLFDIVVVCSYIFYRRKSFVQNFSSFVGHPSTLNGQMLLWNLEIFCGCSLTPRKFKRDGSPSHCLRSKKTPLTLKPATLPPKFKFFPCEKSDVWINETHKKVYLHTPIAYTWLSFVKIYSIKFNKITHVSSNIFNAMDFHLS